MDPPECFVSDAYEPVRVIDVFPGPRIPSSHEFSNLQQLNAHFDDVESENYATRFMYVWPAAVCVPGR